MRCAILLALSTLVSCAPGSGESPSRAAIIGGTPSDASQDAVVLMLVSQGGASGCSGTLLTPRLVLTARHCVSITEAGALCDSTGAPVVGGAIQSDYDPKRIFVFTGRERPDFLAMVTVATRGEQILTPEATNLCDHDLALVLLEKPIPAARIAPVRLEQATRAGEKVTVVGWGTTEASANPSVRMQRTQVPVLEVGPADGLGPNELQIGESVCSGDSGGPAIADSGAVLGVASRGGNGSDQLGAANCIGAMNILTSTVAYADFIRAGYAKAGQEPWLEGQRTPNGAFCSADEECRSGACDTSMHACVQADGGCGIARRRPRENAAPLLVALLGLWLRRRVLFLLRRAGGTTTR